MSFFVDDSERSGLIAFDRARHYCAECKASVWIEVTTRDGRLVQLPMECGHEYDPDAKEPVPDSVTFKGPGRPCKGECGALVFGPQKQWCAECYEPHRKKLQKEWMARQRAEKARAEGAA